MAEGVQAPRADAGVVYERVRRDFVGLLASCSEQELATPVPATPEWRVRDVLAHVVGLAADLALAGAVPVARWVEYLTPSPYIEDILVTKFALDADGLLPIPTGPGLGIEIDEDALKHYSRV